MSKKKKDEREHDTQHWIIMNTREDEGKFDLRGMNHSTVRRISEMKIILKPACSGEVEVDEHRNETEKKDEKC